MAASRPTQDPVGAQLQVLLVLAQRSPATVAELAERIGIPVETCRSAVKTLSAKRHEGRRYVWTVPGRPQRWHIDAGGRRWVKQHGS